MAACGRERSNSHGTGTDDAHKTGVLEVSDQTSSEHDDDQDEPPDGRAEGVVQGVDDGGSGVGVKT